ncbi:MAG: hypothetical protein LBH04_10125 [Tannerellaceae bacterium]|jgi:hypothetical protein|nr:hypothetical protein [Tannerellaceae bacterium]
MKVNFKTIKNIVISVATAATLGLTATSCTNEELQGSNNSPIQNAETMHSISFKVQTPPATRAEDNAASTGAAGKVKLNTGYLFFVNPQQQITKVVEIIPTGTALWGQVLLSTLESTTGATIDSIPGSSTHAYVVANLPAGKTIPRKNLFLSDIMDNNVITLKEEKDLSNTVLTGNAAINKTAALWSVDISKVAPVTARLEIGKITAVNPAGAAVNITEYTIDGIFVDGIYETMDLNAKADSAKTYATNWLYASNYGAPLTQDYYTVVFDTTNVANGLGNSKALIQTPSNSAKVWSYNQFAPGTDKNGAVNRTPKIIIRLNNIKTDQPTTANYSGAYYLTVNELKDNGSGVKVSALEAGKVYHISDIKFELQNLQPVPGQQGVNANVKITLAQWEKFDTDVTLN